MKEEYSNLRKSTEYNFSCNNAEIGERFHIDTTYMDEWGCAIVWYGNKGLELNISYDSGMNQSAFYKLDVNPEDSDDITINTSYLCPMEIDWDAENWIEQLEDEACRALLEIFPELKQIQDTELKHYVIMYPEGNVFSGGYTSKQAAEEMKLTYHHMGALSSHAKIIEVPYEHIPSSMLKRMRDEYGKTGKCTSNLGNFFIQEDDKFLAIANETGDLFIEEFETMRECFDYLSGSSEREYIGQLAIRVENRYISIQDYSEGGFDYTIYDLEFHEINGGVIEDIEDIYDALDNIISDIGLDNQEKEFVDYNWLIDETDIVGSVDMKEKLLNFSIEKHPKSFVEGLTFTIRPMGDYNELYKFEVVKREDFNVPTVEIDEMYIDYEGQDVVIHHKCHVMKDEDGYEFVKIPQKYILSAEYADQKYEKQNASESQVQKTEITKRH